MILRSLVEYYKALEEQGKVTAPGWCQAKVAAALDIAVNGELKGIVTLTTEQLRGKKTMEIPSLLKVPEQGVKTSGISPNFLCGNASYFLGLSLIHI